MDVQAARDALATEIRSWRRRAETVTGSSADWQPARRAIEAAHLTGDDWVACTNAARGLRGLATAFPQDPAERARRVALARAVHEAAFRGEGADFAAARRIADVMRARRTR